ncbi:hypothetical protein [Pelomonas sp. KK5]|uniref:hypothetical protein n=1 Tax=Pelomonas sp. KK5 TaxID=1855730 RepID=UPI00097CA26F|nr:hypothetical protein [Pelomonas sp. KK5]
MSPIRSLMLAVSLLAIAAGPAGAASSAASSASDSASDSVGSISKSITNSSDSSSGDKKVAAGDYKLVQMVAVADQPAMLKLRLRGADGSEFLLALPRQAAENGQLAEGQTITARERPYGLELVAAAQGKTFFLLVDDAWHQELASHPVVL